MCKLFLKKTECKKIGETVSLVESVKVFCCFVFIYFLKLILLKDYVLLVSLKMYVYHVFSFFILYMCFFLFTSLLLPAFVAETEFI